MKLKLAEVELVAVGGADVIVVSGGTLSMTQGWLAGVGSVFPAGSVARTSSAWAPTESPEYVAGLVQDVKVPPSRLHWNVDPASLEVKVKAAPVLLLGLGGPEVTVVSGGVRSITHERLAAVASTFPAGSMARTCNVWLPAAKPV